MQQTCIFSTTNNIINRLSTVLVFSDLALTNIQFKDKETVISKFLCKLWLGVILVVIHGETLLRFLLPCVEALLFLKQRVDL